MNAGFVTLFLLAQAPSQPPPLLPNHILELDGCPRSYEVLTNVRVTADDSLSRATVVERVRESLHANINENTGVSVPLHNIVVSTSVQSGVNRPPSPPQPPALPPPPPPNSPPPSAP